jgi:hypothetical protein
VTFWTQGGRIFFQSAAGGVEGGGAARVEKKATERDKSTFSHAEQCEKRLFHWKKKVRFFFTLEFHAVVKGKVSDFLDHESADFFHKCSGWNGKGLHECKDPTLWPFFVRERKSGFSRQRLESLLPGKKHPKLPEISQVWATFGTNVFFAVFSVFLRVYPFGVNRNFCYGSFFVEFGDSDLKDPDWIQILFLE